MRRYTPCIIVSYMNLMFWTSIREMHSFISRMMLVTVDWQQLKSSMLCLQASDTWQRLWHRRNYHIMSHFQVCFFKVCLLSVSYKYKWSQNPLLRTKCRWLLWNSITFWPSNRRYAHKGSIYSWIHVKMLMWTVPSSA